jgi:8-oxo-dGTP pyrophosphatase MutT (NUDIX family)
MRIRRSARIILLDEENRVLLFKIEDNAVFRPTGRFSTAIAWITPGGGVEEGETDEDAARRELWEETGITEIEIGPLVAICEPVIDWAGETVQGQDRFFLVRLPKAVVTLDNMTALERDVYREHRWWTLDELLAAEERLVPEDLGDLINRIISGNISDEPMMMEQSLWERERRPEG